MLNKIAVKLSDEMLKKAGKVNYSQEVYVYGIEIMLSTLLEIAAILISSTMISALEEGIIFIVLFMSLRIFAGGYHAETYRKCFVATLGSFWGILVVANASANLFGEKMLCLFLLFACVYILVRAPVLNKNQPLSDRKIATNRKKTTITLMVHLFWINGCLQSNKKLMSMAIFTIGLVAAFMLITDINNTGRRDKGWRLS
ncbi:MAG: accessory gene regulator B family protein [Lachnospiraceae bacterium]|nr:accessory gene regulator B family protein [Lachnospiraceae bacterium]